MNPLHLSCCTPEAQACLSLSICAVELSGLLNHRYFSNQSGSVAKLISVTFFTAGTTTRPMRRRSSSNGSSPPAARTASSPCTA